MHVDKWFENATTVADILQVDDFSMFLESDWEKSVRFVRCLDGHSLGRHAIFGGLLDLMDLEQLITASPGVSDASVSIVENFLARPNVYGSGTSNGLSAAMDAFSNGATLLVSGLQYRVRNVRNLCRQFDNTLLSNGLPLKHATTANAYLTPPQAQGLGLHYDNHCALILQLHGTKSWTIYAPRDTLPTKRCAGVLANDAVGDVVMSVRLQPGDVLYLPRGFPHDAKSEDDVSLHLTLGVFATTWSDLLTSIAPNISALRTAVSPSPIIGLSAEQFYNTTVVPALSKVNIAEMLQRRLAESLTELPPLPGDCLECLSNLNYLTLASRLTRSPLVMVMVQMEGGEAVLRCPGVRIALPDIMLPALEFIADTDSFCASDIPSGLASFDRLDLVRLLIRRGVLNLVSLPEPRNETLELDLVSDVRP
jgi:hypothetical protein